ncbi:MAG: hypothetical protein LBQ94_11285 [Treponema sp.]|nr:hypothetical protein [Treponema sp.]
MLAVLLVFGLFAGCANGTTSNNDDEFVLIPVDPIAPPYANIPTLDNYDAIFMGEGHTNRENFEVYPQLMKYYYSLGVRDFAFEEGGHGSALLIQYYIDTGDKECLEFIIKCNEGSPAYNQERYNFYKWMYSWKSTLKQKIKVYNFDVGHSFDASHAAIFFFILKKYSRKERILMGRQ